MKNSVKELTEGMQRLCAVANRIVSQNGDVSRIERDLLLEDLRRLYDVALRLDSSEAENEKRKTESEKEPDEEMLSSAVMAARAAMGVEMVEVKKEPEPEPVPEPEPEPVVVPEPEPEPVVVPEPEPEVVPEPEPEVVPEPEPMPEMETLEANENSLLFDEVIIEPEAPAVPEPPAVPESPAAPEVPAAPVAHEAPEKPTVGTQASLLDYLTHPVMDTPTVRTLGEKLSNKVSDLRTVININDKFSFMSELFHNNMKAYNDFILRLNAIDTRDEALLCVNEVSAQYHWDEASPAVQSFYKVFDKKF